MERLIATHKELPPAVWKKINGYVLRSETPIRLSARLDGDAYPSYARPFRLAASKRPKLLVNAPYHVRCVLRLAAEGTKEAYKIVTELFFRQNSFELVLPPFWPGEGKRRNDRSDKIVQLAQDRVVFALHTWVELDPAAKQIQNLTLVLHPDLAVSCNDFYGLLARQIAKVKALLPNLQAGSPQALIKFRDHANSIHEWQEQRDACDECVKLTTSGILVVPSYLLTFAVRLDGAPIEPSNLEFPKNNCVRPYFDWQMVTCQFSGPLQSIVRFAVILEVMADAFHRRGNPRPAFRLVGCEAL